MLGLGNALAMGEWVGLRWLAVPLMGSECMILLGNMASQ